MQQTASPSTLQSLELAAWATATGPATLGSLSGVLGRFLPAPDPRPAVPAQRIATLLGAGR